MRKEMKSRIAISTFALALAFSATVASHAAGFEDLHGANVPTATSTSVKVKVKLVSFHLRNDSKTPLLLQMGDQQITIAPGATTALKLARGMQIVAVNGTGRVAAGSVISTVDPGLQDNTLVVN